MAPKQTGSKLCVNGSPQRVPAGFHLPALLGHLGITPDRVAIELDGGIVRKPDWPGTPVLPGSRLEIVQFVGGG